MKERNKKRVRVRVSVTVREKIKTPEERKTEKTIIYQKYVYAGDTKTKNIKKKRRNKEIYNNSSIIIIFLLVLLLANMKMNILEKSLFSISHELLYSSLFLLYFSFLFIFVSPACTYF